MGVESSEWVEGTRAEVLELWQVEMEEQLPKLRKPEPEAPQWALLQGAGSRVEYQQSAGPWLVPEAEDERHGAWSATD